MYLHKHDRDELIGYLADKFPKCFFVDPAQRRPLKHNIIEDLEDLKILDRHRLLQNLDWYESHFTYRYNILAGAERIDLDGKKAGTVTVTEQREARAWVEERKLEIARRQEVRPAVVAAKSATTTNGHAGTALHPSLAEIQRTIRIASGLLTEQAYEPLRATLAIAALREIVTQAEKLIDELATT